MSKKQFNYAAIEIDQGYENQVNALENMTPGHTSDFAIEPAITQLSTQRQTWLPAQTPADQLLAQRHQTTGTLRQLLDEQGREPQPTATGHKFIIHEETNAKDRAGAGVRWWLLLAATAFPLALGLGLWLFWGWGFFAFFFTFCGAGLLLGAILLNWQATNNSPITVEKQQRHLDHEYRMFKEENAQRTRELVIGGFLGNAEQDIARNTPVIDGQLLLVDSKNEVKR